jgi:hypothetical protein
MPARKRLYADEITTEQTQHDKEMHLKRIKQMQLEKIERFRAKYEIVSDDEAAAEFEQDLSSAIKSIHKEIAGAPSDIDEPNFEV